MNEDEEFVNPSSEHYTAKGHTRLMNYVLNDFRTILGVGEGNSGVYDEAYLEDEQTCGEMDQCEWELCSMDMQEYGPETCWYQFCYNNCDE